MAAPAAENAGLHWHAESGAAQAQRSPLPSPSPARTRACRRLGRASLEAGQQRVPHIPLLQLGVQVSDGGAIPVALQDVAKEVLQRPVEVRGQYQLQRRASAVALQEAAAYPPPPAHSRCKRRATLQPCHKLSVALPPTLHVAPTLTYGASGGP